MNQYIFDFLFSLTHKYAWLDSLTVFLARDLSWILIICLVILAAIYFRREKTLEVAVFAASSAIIAWAGSRIIKLLFDSERPFVSLPSGSTLLTYASTQAFPSGHASFLFALAISVYFYHRRLGVFCIIAALLVSLARVATGLHWPIDVAGGFFLGLIVALVLRYFVLKHLRPRSFV